jgi:hypothetical protein
MVTAVTSGGGQNMDKVEEDLGHGHICKKWKDLRADSGPVPGTRQLLVL